MYFLQKESKSNANFAQANMADICASLQYTLVRTLMLKLRKAVKKTGVKRVAIAGGVSANSGLRAALQEYAGKYGWEVFIPAFEYCTDNAGMIAMAAHFKYEAGEFSEQDISPMPRMKF
jgi:N6-L-threonylcarbamoyladenine synthase